MSLSFSKEPVAKGIPRNASELSVAAPAEEREREATSPAAAASAFVVSVPSHSFTVVETLHAIQSAAPQLGVSLRSDISSYCLRVADDDGSADPDFPDVDGSCTITQVGVDRFLLVDSTNDAQLLMLSIPQSEMSVRRNGVEPLVLHLSSLVSAGGGGAARSVTIKLQQRT
jgi:hypothetical protein